MNGFTGQLSSRLTGFIKMLESNAVLNKCMCENRTKFNLVLSFPILTLSKLIHCYFLQLSVFLFGFHRFGVLTQKWTLYVVLAAEPLSRAGSGQPSCGRAWVVLLAGQQGVRNNSPPMNNTLMSLLPIRVEPALCFQGNVPGEGEIWEWKI